MKNSLRSNLKKLLYEKDMTVAQLSRATKIPPQTLNNWLSGQEPRKVDQLKVVSNYFKISLDELLFGESKILASPITEYSDEINAGVYEVVLRKIKK